MADDDGYRCQQRRRRRLVQRMVACFGMLSRRRRTVRLVLWGGEVRAARHGKMAGQVMLDFTDSVVCRADGFCIGRPAPVLAIEDRLVAGRTYLVLPVDRLPQGYDAVTAASLAALSYDRGGAGAGDAGATSIAGGAKSPSTAWAAAGDEVVEGGGGGGGAQLCSTPELRKHYEQLVGAARCRAWSPRLETIKERKGARRIVVAAVSPGRLSPVAARLLGLDRGAS
ncbi:hypothetical protein OsJ_10886 [Oryza sativa Japonica Group]|uniref:Uncharacterized protein n=1 Tax=Oryza sativa subsp. japonica TaxID=39947 RepID=B9F8H7_ORYSJ|nr:hypothetical protein OsJ_10886 [Oryza sativa Japonica Group]